MLAERILLFTILALVAGFILAAPNCKFFFSSSLSNFMGWLFLIFFSESIIAAQPATNPCVSPDKPAPRCNGQYQEYNVEFECGNACQNYKYCRNCSIRYIQANCKCTCISGYAFNNDGECVNATGIPCQKLYLYEGDCGSDDTVYPIRNP